jgi:hypothetical protein
MEVLLAAGIGALVLGGMITIFGAIRKMAGVGELAGTLQEASLALAYIEKDLTQAVQKPDPAVDSPVVVAKDHFQMLRAEFEPDGTIKGKLVVYQVIGTDGGNFRLKRRFGSQESPIPGIFRRVQFASFDGPGGPFVRVTLVMAVTDTANPTAGKGFEEAVLSGLVRVMGPEMIGSQAYGFDLMQSLKGIDFLKDL